MRASKQSVLHTAGVALLVIALAPFVAVATPQVVGAEHSYVVTSGSMEPALSPGDVVVVDETPPEAVEAGDIVTFADGPGMEHVTTHRVVEVTTRDGRTYFRTKGDANEEADIRPVPASDLVGRMAFSLPYVGHVVLFAQTRAGLALLVIAPGALLVATELWALVRPDGGDDADAGGGGGAD